MPKKITAFSVAVLLVTVSVLLCGCGKAAPKPDKMTIELEANATTGYVWSFSLSSEDIVTVKDKYVENEHPEDVVGAGGRQVYTITSKKAGTVDLTCTYRRPWDVDVSSVAVYHLKVDENLKITELSHEGTYF